MLNLLSRFLFVVILTLISFFSNAQEINVLSDLQLISKSINEKQTYVRPYIYKDSNSTFLKYNPVSLVFGGLLFVYQNSISYQFSADCLYNPSCSQFSKNAIREYGLFKGCLLSADRLMRCNRISAAGIPACKFNTHTHKVYDSVDFYSITK